MKIFLIENIDCLVFKKVTFLFDDHHLFSITGIKETKWFDVHSKKWSNGPEMNKDRIRHGCVKIPQTIQHKPQVESPIPPHTA